VDPLLREDRRGHVAHALDGERPVDRAEERQLGLLAEAAIAELGLDEERDLERRRRALVRDARDADDDPAAGEGVERLAQLRGGLGRVEVVRLLAEVLDLLGEDPAVSMRVIPSTTRLTFPSSSERSGRTSLSARSWPMAMYM
jgi:hypothetical protein